MAQGSQMGSGETVNILKLYKMLLKSDEYKFDVKCKCFVEREHVDLNSHLKCNGSH